MVLSSKKRINEFSYDLNNELGKGSFSKVYKGFNEQEKQTVALKVIPTASIKGPEFLELIHSEINTMKALDNPNIVKLITVLNTPNNYYLIQEFCEGGDVQQQLDQRGRIPEEEIIAIIKAMSNAFKDLIAKGIIHRDVKPSNIFIKEGVYKLGDFGFASFLKNPEEYIQTKLIGTPLYMSPQGLGRTSYSLKADIWSLGMTVYQLLFNKLPWKCNNHLELLNAINSQPLTFPPNAHISHLLIEYLIKSLIIDEEKRINWKQIDDMFLSDHIFSKKYRSISSTTISSIKKYSDVEFGKDKGKIINFFDIFQQSLLSVKLQNHFTPLHFEKILFLFLKFKSKYLENYKNKLLIRSYQETYLEMLQLKNKLLPQDIQLQLKNDPLFSYEISDLKEFTNNFYIITNNILVNGIRQTFHQIQSNLKYVYELSYNQKLLTSCFYNLMKLKEIINQYQVYKKIEIDFTLKTPEEFNKDDFYDLKNQIYLSNYQHNQCQIKKLKVSICSKTSSQKLLFLIKV